MAIFKSILFVTLVTLSAVSYKIPQSDSTISINSQKDLVDFLKANLGQNTPDISQELKDYIGSQGLSVLTAAEEIALLLTDKEQTPSSNDFEITSDFVSLLGEAASRIKTHDMSGKTEEEIEQFVVKNLDGQSVKKIQGKPQEIKKMHAMMNKHHTRVLQEATLAEGQSFSYITKFFFIILFMIVAFGSLCSIANMENRKDTLLYAKFIADVGR